MVIASSSSHCSTNGFGGNRGPRGVGSAVGAAFVQWGAGLDGGDGVSLWPNRVARGAWMDLWGTVLAHCQRCPVAVIWVEGAVLAAAGHPF